MILHTALGAHPFKRSRQLKMLMDRKGITFAGNLKLRIFGKLDCASGKRMKVQNRVFFKSVVEAGEMGYRPCGHCMQMEYKLWKQKKQG